jgi:hypothetical protein
VEPPTISVGWLTPRPFAPADIPWVHEVSLDSAVQQYVLLPSPHHRREHAAFFVQQLAIAGWDTGRWAFAELELATTAEGWAGVPSPARYRSARQVVRAAGPLDLSCNAVARRIGVGRPRSAPADHGVGPDGVTLVLSTDYRERLCLERLLGLGYTAAYVVVVVFG